MKDKKWKIGFAIYCALMLVLLFGRNRAVEGLPYWEQLRQHFNPVPLRTITNYVRLLSSANRGFVRAAVINLFGNLVMFVPLGYFLPGVFPKMRAFWKVLLTTAAVITVVELLQMLTLVGSCDIDDLILNLIGSALGYCVYKCIVRK